MNLLSLSDTSSRAKAGRKNRTSLTCLTGDVLAKIGSSVVNRIPNNRLASIWKLRCANGDFNRSDSFERG